MQLGTDPARQFAAQPATTSPLRAHSGNAFNQRLQQLRRGRSPEYGPVLERSRAAVLDGCWPPSADERACEAASRQSSLARSSHPCDPDQDTHSPRLSTSGASEQGSSTFSTECSDSTAPTSYDGQSERSESRLGWRSSQLDTHIGRGENSVFGPPPTPADGPVLDVADHVEYCGLGVSALSSQVEAPFRASFVQEQEPRIEHPIWQAGISAASPFGIRTNSCSSAAKLEKAHIPRTVPPPCNPPDGSHFSDVSSPWKFFHLFHSWDDSTSKFEWDREYDWQAFDPYQRASNDSVTAWRSHTSDPFFFGTFQRDRPGPSVPNDGNKWLDVSDPACIVLDLDQSEDSNIPSDRCQQEFQNDGHVSSTTSCRPVNSAVGAVAPRSTKLDKCDTSVACPGVDATCNTSLCHVSTIGGTDVNANLAADQLYTVPSHSEASESETRKREDLLYTMPTDLCSYFEQGFPEASGCRASDADRPPSEQTRLMAGIQPKDADADEDEDEDEDKNDEQVKLLENSLCEIDSHGGRSEARIDSTVELQPVSNLDRSSCKSPQRSSKPMTLSSDGVEKPRDTPNITIDTSTTRRSCLQMPRKLNEWLSDQKSYDPRDAPSVDAVSPASSALLQASSDGFTQYSPTASSVPGEPLIKSINRHLDKSSSRNSTITALPLDFAGVTDGRLAHLFSVLSEEGIITADRLKYLLRNATERAGLDLPESDVSYWLACCVASQTDILDLEAFGEVLHVVFDALSEEFVPSDLEWLLASLDPLGAAAERSLSLTTALMQSDGVSSQSSDGIQQHAPFQPVPTSTDSQDISVGSSGLQGRQSRKRGATDDLRGFDGSNGPSKKVAANNRDDNGRAEAHEVLPCVVDGCSGRDRFIANMARKIEMHGKYCCNTCYKDLRNRTDKEAHVNAHSCRRHCIARDCPRNLNATRDAEAVKAMCHEFVQGQCPQQSRKDLKKDQWRLIYAVSNPDCTNVPDLEFQEGEEIAHDGPGSSSPRQSRVSHQQLLQDLQEKDALLRRARDAAMVHERRIQQLERERIDAENRHQKAEAEKGLLRKDLKHYASLLRMAHSAMVTNGSSAFASISAEIESELPSTVPMPEDKHDAPQYGIRMEVPATPSSSGMGRVARDAAVQVFHTAAPNAYATPASSGTGRKPMETAMPMLNTHTDMAVSSNTSDSTMAEHSLGTGAENNDMMDIMPDNALSFNWDSSQIDFGQLFNQEQS